MSSVISDNDIEQLLRDLRDALHQDPTIYQRVKEVVTASGVKVQPLVEKKETPKSSSAPTANPSSPPTAWCPPPGQSLPWIRPNLLHKGQYRQIHPNSSPVAFENDVFSGEWYVPRSAYVCMYCMAISKRAAQYTVCYPPLSF